MAYGKKPDIQKHRQWQQIIRTASRSGLSIREFCRQRHIKEPQFYWWQRKLKAQRPRRHAGPYRQRHGTASFALVSDQPGALAAGIELVLPNGRRLRISQGVDEATLRTVLATLEAAAC